MTGGPNAAADTDGLQPARLSRRRAALVTARQAGRSSLVSARRVAGGQGMLPGFLIVGAQRCGTTSMVRALSRHPAVFSAAQYLEVHYFDIGYDRGLAWYRSHFPHPARARLAARSAGAEPVAFESSPYYMFHPLAAGRIARDLPGVKLLVLLRDPVERAYSGWAHAVSIGCETEPFERALELEDARLAGEAERLASDPGYASYSHQHHSHRTRGQYAEQLERLERLFGRDQIHIVDSGAFFTDPEPEYAVVLDFLGLAARGSPGLRRRNASPRAPMSEATRAALKEHYRPHDERLARWLGHQPSWRA